MATAKTFEKVYNEYMFKFPMGQNPVMWFEVVGMEPLLDYMNQALEEGEPLRFEQIEPSEEIIVLDGYRVFIGEREIE